ncbi:MAG: nicotinate-nicotinamide nucleotide adenylyltransferase [Bulleidia sp.]
MSRGLLFGGAFNPPTIAHLDGAYQAMMESGKDYVMFVPSKSQYIRFDQKKDMVYPDEVRLDMLRLCAKEREWMKVSDHEIRCESQPRTYETLCALKQQGYDCALLFGSDKLQEFSTAWRYTKEIAEQFGIVCMSRNSLDTQAIIEHDPLLMKLKEWIQVVEIPEQYQRVSSSDVRRMIRDNNMDEVRNLIPSSLYEYVEKEIRNA